MPLPILQLMRYFKNKFTANVSYRDCIISEKHLPIVGKRHMVPFPIKQKNLII